MTLRLNGSTSGYVEIDAPATAGSNTLVLPTGNGTNGQYLQTNGSGSLSWATVSAAGRIIQIQSTTSSAQVSTSSGSFQPTGFSLSITPSSINSKIIILCITSGTPNAGNNGIIHVVRRGSTEVTNKTAIYNDGSANDTWRPTTLFGIDSPSTTSSTSYELYFRSASSALCYSNWGATAAQQMHLLELEQ